MTIKAGHAVLCGCSVCLGGKARPDYDAMKVALERIVSRLSHVCGSGSANVDDALREAQIALGVKPIPRGFQHVDF